MYFNCDHKVLQNDVTGVYRNQLSDNDICYNVQVKYYCKLLCYFSSSKSKVVTLYNLENTKQYKVIHILS